MAQPQPKIYPEENDDFIFSPDLIKEIKLGLQEIREGKTIPDDQFEEYFCK